MDAIDFVGFRYIRGDAEEGRSGERGIWWIVLIRWGLDQVGTNREWT